VILGDRRGIIVLPIEQGWASASRCRCCTAYGARRAPACWSSNVCLGTSIWWPSSSNLPGEREPGIIVAGFQAPLTFLNAYHFRRDILAALKSSPQRPRLLVLEATGIVEIDFTAAQVCPTLFAGVMPMASICHRPA